MPNQIVMPNQDALNAKRNKSFTDPTMGKTAGDGTGAQPTPAATASPFFGTGSTDPMPQPVRPPSMGAPSTPTTSGQPAPNWPATATPPAANAGQPGTNPLFELFMSYLQPQANTAIQNNAAAPDISSQNWSGINPNSTEMSQLLSQFIGQQGGNLNSGPGNAFSPAMLAQMRQASVRDLSTANQQAQAGAANSAAARGLTGPNLSSIFGTQIDAANRAALANSDLNNQVQGLTLGNQQYANLTNAYNALAGANQAEANRAGSETSQDYLQQLQGNQQIQQQVQDTLDKMGLAQQQNTQQNYSDTLKAMLQFMTDPAAFLKFVSGKEGNTALHSAEQVLEALQGSIAQYGGDLSRAQPQVTFDANGNQVITPGGVESSTPITRDQVAAIANSINSPWGGSRPRSGPEYIGSQSLPSPISAFTNFQTFGQGDPNTWSSTDAVNLNNWFNDAKNQAAIQALQQQYHINKSNAPTPEYMNALLQAAQQAGIDFGGYQFK